MSGRQRAIQDIRFFCVRRVALNKIKAIMTTLHYPTPRRLHSVFRKKTGPFVTSSYLHFDKDELHEDPEKYTGDIGLCEYDVK